MEGLFKFCFFLIVVMVIFHFCTKKYLNPYKLYMVFGKKGSGKTTLMTRLAFDHLKMGFTVYCTEHINVPGVRYFDVQWIGKKSFDSNSLVLIDEVGMIWDNRNFKTFAIEVRDWFKLQRHYKCKVYLFSQTFDVDKKLRDLTDGLYLCNTVLRVFTWAKRIHRKVVLTESESDRESRISENLEFDSILTWPFGGRILTYIPKYSPFFDSHCVPELDPIPFIEMESPPTSTESKSLFCCVKFICSSLMSKLRSFFSSIRKRRKSRRSGKYEKPWE